VAGRAAAPTDQRLVAGPEDEHTFNQPVPITARIVWELDGEEYIETVAAGWSGQNVYVRLFADCRAATPDGDSAVYFLHPDFAAFLE
jgi:hypothetical protein